MIRRLLIVDDDLCVRRALMRWARASGYEAACFDRGIAFLATHIPPEACLILDLALPDLDGGDVKRRLVAEHRDLPTVFISAMTDEKIALALAGIEAPRVLRKPFEAAELSAAIASAG